MKDLWSGVACLKASPEVKNFRRFGKGKGAFVNIVAWADSQSDFEVHVKRQVEDLDCILVELEGVHLLEDRMKAEEYPEELITMRETANRQPDDTVFGTFHVWYQNESN